MINNDWNEILDLKSKHMIDILEYIKNERKKNTIFPPEDSIFNAFKLASFADIKLVILGQDPYHNDNQANGLAFSVNKGEKIPPSLKNIFKEMVSELNIEAPTSGDLTNLAKEGVLLLNTTLTVVKNKPNSHSKIGWELFTDNVITKLNDKAKPVVFLLWGNNAIRKERLITNPSHLVLKAAHPSPLSANRGFFGCNHFIKTNEFLKQNNITPVDFTVICKE